CLTLVFFLAIGLVYSNTESEVVFNINWNQSNETLTFEDQYCYTPDQWLKKILVLDNFSSYLEMVL
ncbi:MAG: hypothetical protein AAFO07_25445, partial [Bacteroidota bacterium]